MPRKNFNGLLLNSVSLLLYEQNYFLSHYYVGIIYFGLLTSYSMSKAGQYLDHLVLPNECWKLLSDNDTSSIGDGSDVGHIWRVSDGHSLRKTVPPMAAPPCGLKN